MAAGGYQPNEFNQTVIENLHIHGPMSISESSIKTVIIAGNTEVDNIDTTQADAGIRHEDATSNLAGLEKTDKGKLSHEKDFERIFQLLNELRQLIGSEDLDILLRLAECEIQYKTGKEEVSIQKLRDFIRSSGSHSARNVQKMGLDQKTDKSYLRALILYRISSDLHETENVSSDDAVEWISALVLDVGCAAKPLVEAGDRSRDIGIVYGLEFMESCLSNLRSMTNTDPDVRAFNEASCLFNITVSCSHALEYQKCIHFAQEGVEVLEKQFGSNASKYKCYGYLLHNMGAAHPKYDNWLLNNLGDSNVISEHYSKAERYHVKALEAKEKASDYQNENEKLEKIKKTKQNLAINRRMISQ